MGEILGRYAEPAGGDLLDLVVEQKMNRRVPLLSRSATAVTEPELCACSSAPKDSPGAWGRLHGTDPASVDIAIFAAFTGVGTATEHVHRDGDGLVGLRAERAKRHGAGDKTFVDAPMREVPPQRESSSEPAGRISSRSRRTAWVAGDDIARVKMAKAAGMGLTELRHSTRGADHRLQCFDGRQAARRWGSAPFGLPEADPAVIGKIERKGWDSALESASHVSRRCRFEFRKADAGERCRSVVSTKQRSTTL